MGISRERLTDPTTLPEAYICQICLEILDNPHTVCTEDHLFCKACSDDFFSNQNVQQATADNEGRAFKSFDCPICKNTRSYHRQNYRTSKLAGRLIGQLKIFCINRELGCKWSGELSNEAGHLASCPRRLVMCPNGCGLELRVNKLRRHRIEECEDQALVCPRAKDEDKCQYLRYEADMHVDQCEYWKCRVNKNCTTTGTLEMLELTHEPYCRELHDSLARAQSGTGILELEKKVTKLQSDLESKSQHVQQLRKLVVSKDEELVELQEMIELMEEEGFSEEFAAEEYLDEIYSAIAQQAESLKKTDTRVAIRDAEIKRLEKEIKSLKPKVEEVDEEELLLPVHPAFGIVKGVKRKRGDSDSDGAGDEDIGGDLIAVASSTADGISEVVTNASTSHVNGYSSRFLKLIKLG